jgi:O-antigen ligase
MQRFFRWLDDLAMVDGRAGITLWLDRAAFFFLILMVLAAPHSIAATQTAMLTGMFLWVVGLAIRKLGRRGTERAEDRPRASRPGSVRWLGYSLWAFFLWSVVSSLMSYEPATSLDRLRGVALFFIFFFVMGLVRSRRAAYFLVLALIVSCMVNVVWMPIQRLIGRGVEIHGLSPVSPLAKAAIFDGDTLLEVEGKKIHTPEEAVAELEKRDVSDVTFYRPDFEATMPVKRAEMLPGDTALQKLGVDGWSKSSNFRSHGFYRHYVTYAEALQLITSLVFGLVIAALTRRKRWAEAGEGRGLYGFFSSTPFLIFALAGMCLALLLTVTRASQLAFMVSAFAIVVLGASRKMLIAAVLIALPVVFGGLLFLQQSRNTGFFDAKDESTRNRTVMWRDGMRLWTENPHNFVFGLGMDSIQKHWQEWGMFEGGFLPMGHFHSMPVQLLAERGLPALLLWLTILGLYGWILFKGIRRQRSDPPPDSRDWMSFGILLGCLGGTIGFFTSGLVHYNLGDQVVAMIFYLLMGLGVSIVRFDDVGARSDSMP